MKWPTRFRWFTLIAIVAGTLALSACGNASVRSKFKKIVPGMGINQVTNLLGEPDAIAVRSRQGLPGSRFTWRSNGVVIAIDFIKGRVAATRLVQN